MDFTTINSLGGYMKNMKLQTKWEIKKANGDFKHKSELEMKNEQFKDFYAKQAEDNKNDEMLTSIHNKINAGAKLSSEELEYLRTKDPTSYQKLKRLEAEKKQYEKDLKKCKTKDDVQKLKMSKVASSLSTLSSVKNNPNIPEGKKLEVFQDVQRRMDAIEKITVKFVNSGRYHDLPTEAEKRKAEQEIHKAEERERKEAAENIKEQIENMKPVGAEEDPETEKTAKADTPEQTHKTPKAVKTEENAHSDAVTDEYGREIKSRSEAEQSAEAKKVRRAKARTSYEKASYSQDTAAALVMQNVFSEKA